MIEEEEEKEERETGVGIRQMGWVELCLFLKGRGEAES